TALKREIRHDLADYGRELVPMPRARRRNRHLWKLRVPVEHEVLVGHVGEDTCLHRESRTVGIGKVARNSGPQVALVGEVAIALDRFWRTRLEKVMEVAELEPRHTIYGESVKPPLFRFEVEDRKRAGLEELRSQRLCPDQN